jgi:transposase
VTSGFFGPLGGGYLKAVHHPESLERAIFKQLVLLYHDGVRERVRAANRVMAYLRRHGIFVREKAFANPPERSALCQWLPPSPLVASNLQLLWESYDLAAKQVTTLRRRVLEVACKEAVIARFVQLPGISWLRAATFFVSIDTPWRFLSKARLWKYLGIGLERRHSGTGRVQVHLVKHANRQLKSVLMGAALKAIALGDNPYAGQYQRWLRAGMSASTARRNVARSLAVTLWGMWKNGSAYRPDWVGVAAAAVSTKLSSKVVRYLA